MASIRFHSVREVTNQLQSAAAQDMKFMSARHEAAVPASPPDVRYWGQTRRDAGVPRSRSLTPTRHSPIERHRSTKSRELKIERSQPRPIGNLHSLIITKNGFQRLYNAVRPPAM